MAEVSEQLDLELKIRLNLQLTEVEGRALEAMVCYGFEPFKKVFYDKLGEAYMKKHEAGLKILFESVKKQVVPKLNKIDKFKTELTQSLVKTNNKVILK